ncbi:MAG: nucleotidyltransferase [Nitrospiraceae bacterium]|nr:MAG: nucleotidyltransferase [Nitrospiraceae bacterium]
MTNLIPMAGAGARFSAEGYQDPKPLIEVSGKPMIIQACNSLPPADRWIFVCRKEHIENYHIDSVLKRSITGSEIITVDYLTDGQASTCLLAEHLLDRKGPLLIGPCDNGMTWNRGMYDSLMMNPEVDALIWTFRNNVTVKRNPKMYGWVAVDKDNNALKVSCKIPISDNPVKDHAIVGTFYFRKAGYFIDGAKRMIDKDRRINNEFYVDEAMNELIEAGMKVKVFEIDKYICWGTPNDLRVYQYWESYFRKLLVHGQL